MKKLLIFDLDNTILDFEMSESYALKKVFENHNIVFTKDMYKDFVVFNEKLWKAREKEEISSMELRQQRFKNFFKKYNIDIDPWKFELEYEDILLKNVFFIKDSIDVIEKLSKKYILVIATNGIKHIQEKRLDVSGVRKYFDNIFISDDIGYNKPQKKFFDYIFERYKDIKKENIVMIGDTLSSDIKGAKISNIKSIWYNPFNKKLDKDIVADFEIKNLEQIFDILEKI